MGGLKNNLQQSETRMLELQRDIRFVFGLEQRGEASRFPDLEELNKEYATAQVDRLVKQARYMTIQNTPMEVIDALAGSSGQSPLSS